MKKKRVRLSKDMDDFSSICNLFNEAKPVKVKKERKKKIGHLTADFADMGGLWKTPKERKRVIKFKPAKKEAKKKAKKAKKVKKAVEDMTPGERAQHEAAKVANRLYGAKAKAPKFA